AERAAARGPVRELSRACAARVQSRPAQESADGADGGPALRCGHRGTGALLRLAGDDTLHAVGRQGHATSAAVTRLEDDQQAIARAAQVRVEVRVARTDLVATILPATVEPDRTE